MHYGENTADMNLWIFGLIPLLNHSAMKDQYTLQIFSFMFFICTLSLDSCICVFATHVFVDVYLLLGGRQSVEPGAEGEEDTTDEEFMELLTHSLRAHQNEIKAHTRGAKRATCDNTNGKDIQNHP